MSSRPSREFGVDQLEVLHLDNHTVAVNKPAGVLVQGDETEDRPLTAVVKAWLKREFAKPGDVWLGLVHRLDRPVCGVVVFARTSKGASRLSEQIRARRWCKEYLAITGRCPAEPEGVLDHRLKWDGTRTRVVKRGGQEARLSYRILREHGGRYAWHIRLETGRKHQIRAQLAAVGCPLLGDRRYGAIDDLRRGAIALCAWRVTYEHPTQQQPITVTAPLPEWLDQRFPGITKQV